MHSVAENANSTSHAVLHFDPVFIYVYVVYIVVSVIDMVKIYYRLGLELLFSGVVAFNLR